jgi:hypothetical protein
MWDIIFLHQTDSRMNLARSQPLTSNALTSWLDFHGAKFPKNRVVKKRSSESYLTMLHLWWATR